MCRARFLCHPEGKRARSCSASEASGLVASRSSLQVGALPKVRLVEAASSLSSGGAPSAKVPQASLASGARSSCAIQARKRARSFQVRSLPGPPLRLELAKATLPQASSGFLADWEAEEECSARSRNARGKGGCNATDIQQRCWSQEPPLSPDAASAPFDASLRLRSKLRGRCEIMLPGSTRRHRLLLTLSLGRPRSSLLWLAVPLEMQIL